MTFLDSANALKEEKIKMAQLYIERERPAWTEGLIVYKCTLTTSASDNIRRGRVLLVLEISTETERTAERRLRTAEIEGLVSLFSFFFVFVGFASLLLISCIIILWWPRREEKGFSPAFAIVFCILIHRAAADPWRPVPFFPLMTHPAGVSLSLCGS